MSISEPKQFLYTISPSRPELILDGYQWTTEEIDIGTRHFAHLQRATEAGKVILAGRSLDGVGPAVVIFEAATEEDAREFMSSDPFIASGLMTSTLHPFRASLVRKQD